MEICLPFLPVLFNLPAKLRLAWASAETAGFVSAVVPTPALGKLGFFSEKAGSVWKGGSKEAGNLGGCGQAAPVAPA